MYQFWLHTQTIKHIPLMEGIFSTPSSHRVHHAKNPMYIDRNYGGTLVIWDRLFSTWQPELTSEPCHYGTTRPLNTLNPVKANFQHWHMLTKDSFHTQSWRNKIGLWFKPTGWRPQDCKDKSTTENLLQKTGCQQREKYDPQVSATIKLYSGLSFLCIILVAVMFIFLAPSLSGIKLASGAALITYSLIVVNDFLEGKKRFALLEIIRLPMMLWMLSTLWYSTSTTRIINTIVMERTSSQVLAYVSSPGLWSEWHSKSSKVYANSQLPLTKGDTFEEDITTALGENHLTWVVVESSSDSWTAHAQNQNNGSTIQLQYRVYKVGGKTTFKRTLDYTLPNFALIVINTLYFKSSVEQRSDDTLRHLKKALERRPPFA